MKTERLAVLLLAILTLAACVSRSDILFQTHKPYSQVYREPGWAALVVPEAVGEEPVIYEVKAGLAAKDKYVIHWGEAVRIQFPARFRNNYDEGARLIPAEMADELKTIISEAKAASKRTPDEGDRWRDAAREAAEAARIRAGAEDDDPYFSQLLEFAQDPPRHYVELENPVYAIEGSRLTFAFQGVLRKGADEEELLRKSFSAASENLKLGSNTVVTEKRVQRHAVEPVSGTLYLFAEAIRDRLAE